MVNNPIGERDTARRHTATAMLLLPQARVPARPVGRP